MCIVSHGHGSMVVQLVERLLSFESVDLVILIKNVPERLDLPASPRLTVICNEERRGFAENHNLGFEEVESLYFCVVNPDVIVESDPFPALIQCFNSSTVGIVAPMILSSNGEVEDSARYFPTVGRLLKKFFWGDKGAYQMFGDASCLTVEWVAGMFMFFTRESFLSLNGFDSRFFLYYEDVDICVRSWRSKRKVLLCRDVFVTHDAQRSSRKHARYAIWHFQSMIRYFFKHIGRLPRVGG